MNSRGFTLVEILVVLVIVGLASLVLTQGLGQIFSARARLGPFLDQSNDAARIGVWFRQVAGGVFPDTEGGTEVFSGNSNAIQGLTLMPMGANPGAPTSFRMEINHVADGRVSLRSVTLGGPIIDLFSWREDQPGAGTARFSFYDGFAWFDHWPLQDSERRIQSPPGIMPTKHPQLPKLIRLDAVLGGRSWVLVASPHGPDLPRPKLSDLLK